MEQFKFLSKSIAHGLWDRSLRPVAVVCVVLAVADAASRLKLTHHLISDTEVDSHVRLEFESLGGDLLKHYIAKLPSDQGSEDKAVLPDAIDAKTNEVSSLGIDERYGFWRNDNLSFKLLGVIEHHEKVAVLDRFDHTSGERNLVEARVGDKVGGFVTSNISRNVVTLEEGSSERQLLRMFERADSADASALE